MLLHFNSNGLLPKDIYKMTIEKLRNSMLVQGPPNRPDWDKKQRIYLLDNLEIVAAQLWQARIDPIFIDGSFVEEKDHPNDIDGYFLCDFYKFSSGVLQKELNIIAGERIWTWSKSHRKPMKVEGQTKYKLPMWIKYRVELYPVLVKNGKIYDDFFVKLFRLSKENKPKGIVQLIRSKGR